MHNDARCRVAAPTSCLVARLGGAFNATALPPDCTSACCPHAERAAALPGSAAAAAAGQSNSITDNGAGTVAEAVNADAGNAVRGTVVVSALSLHATTITPYDASLSACTPNAA